MKWQKVLVYFLGVAVASAISNALQQHPLVVGDGSGKFAILYGAFVGLLVIAIFSVFAFWLPRRIAKRIDEAAATKPVDYVRELQKKNKQAARSTKSELLRAAKEETAAAPEEHYHLCPACGTLTPYFQTKCDCGYVFRTRPPVNRRAVIALSVACACLLAICYGLYTDKKQTEDAARMKASAMYSDGYNEGYGVGYREGESIGIDKGAESADATYYNDGFGDGYITGYNEGYEIGRDGKLNWGAEANLAMHSGR